MIFRAKKNSLLEVQNRSLDSDIAYLHGLRNHKLELVKSQVSQDAPPSFLTNTPLGETLKSPKAPSNFPSESIVKKKQPSKKIQKTTWLLEELSFTMNKMSLAGLVFGLMVLGTLFFVIGFLAAVATLGTNSKQTHHSWATLSSGPGAAAGAATGLAGRIAGKLIRDEAVKLEAKMGGGALGGVITQHVPAPLQPFAQQAQNRFASMGQQGINRVATPLIAGVRGPQRFAAPAPTPGAASPFAPRPSFQQPPLPQRPAAPVAYPPPTYPAPQPYTSPSRTAPSAQNRYAPQGYPPPPTGSVHP